MSELSCTPDAAQSAAESPVVLTAVSTPTVESEALGNEPPSSAATAGPLTGMGVHVADEAPAVEYGNALAAVAAQVADLGRIIAAREGGDFAGQAIGNGLAHPDSLTAGAGGSTPGWPTSSASPAGVVTKSLRTHSGSAGVNPVLNPGEIATGRLGAGPPPFVFEDSMTGTVGIQSTWGGHCSALITALTPTGWEDLGLTVVAAGILGAIVALLLRKVMVEGAVVEHDISQSRFT